MPATFTRYPVDVERKDTGMGGRPPADRRPTGGGGSGDDNWERRSSRRRGPRELLTHYRIAMLYALALDLTFFVVLGGALLIRESSSLLAPGLRYPTAWHSLPVPPIVWINTALLLLSVVTMELARRPFFSEVEIMEEWLGLGRPALRRSIPWLLTTLVLGGLFLAGQWVSWRQLATEGIRSGTTPGSQLFYLMTRVHALHLLAGMAAVIGTIGSMFFIRRVTWRQIAIDCAAWFWYAISAFWLLIFVLLLYIH